MKVAGCYYCTYYAGVPVLCPLHEQSAVGPATSGLGAGSVPGLTLSAQPWRPPASVVSHIAGGGDHPEGGK